MRKLTKKETAAKAAKFKATMAAKRKAGYKHGEQSKSRDVPLDAIPGRLPSERAGVKPKAKRPLKGTAFPREGKFVYVSNGKSLVLPLAVAFEVMDVMNVVLGSMEPK